MLIGVQSMTAALNLKKKLADENIRAQVVQKPKGLQKKGCGYAVRVEKENLEAVRTAANALGIKITGVYEAG